MHNQFNAGVKFNDKISDNLPFQKRCYVPLVIATEKCKVLVI